MSLETANFPYREITGNEFEYIESLIGTPEVDEHLLCDLFEEGRMVLHDDHLVVSHLHDAMKRTLHDVGEESEQGERLFLGGAFFYAAVFSHINDVKRLPIHEAGISKLKNKNPSEVLKAGPETLRTLAGPFKNLLDRILPTVGGGNELGILANIGANSLNMAVIESKVYYPPSRFPQELPDALRILEADPDWAALRAQFDGFGD